MKQDIIHEPTRRCEHCNNFFPKEELEGVECGEGDYLEVCKSWKEH